MKKICFLILFTLQIPFSSFSQTDSSLHTYTDAEITKLSDYINNIEKANPSAVLSESDIGTKKEITDLINKPTHAYTDNEVIKLNDYIKYLEKNKSAAGASAINYPKPKTPSNDSLHAYTDAEASKLTNHINELEKRVFATNTSGLNMQEQKEIGDMLANPAHEYTDMEVIKLANYIKHLAKLDSLNALTIAKVDEKVKENPETEKEIVKAIEAGKEYHLEEEKDIDKYEKLVFFNFNSSILKDESFKPLDEVVKILKSYVNLNFVVEGYCDSIGSAVYNLSLSKRRAASVKAYFVSKGIPASRLAATGYGKEFPIATNMTEEGRAQNRRVAIKAKRKNKA